MGLKIETGIKPLLDTSKPQRRKGNFIDCNMKHPLMLFAAIVATGDLRCSARS